MIGSRNKAKASFMEACYVDPLLAEEVPVLCCSQLDPFATWITLL